MSSSRYLNPTTPGGLLSPQTGDELTDSETLVMQALAADTYLITGETPTGAINGANTSFTLANAPDPAGSLRVTLNGTRLTLTTDYTLSGTTLTMLVAPITDSLLRVDYTNDPN